MIDYKGSIHGLINDLQARYPGFTFTTRHGYGEGERIEIVRLPSYPSSLYALITDSVTEIRKEMDAAKQELSS